MVVGENLRTLIENVAPLFAGEAEIFSTYWDAPSRSNDSDKLWIQRQARKEVWDTPLGDPRGLFVGPLEDLLADFPSIDDGVPRANILDRLETLYEEFSHYCAFADAYDALCGPGESRLSPAMLKDVPDWPENEAIRDRRAAIKRDYGVLGERACFFTEGGYCTLFSEGIRLKGRGGADDLIASACAKVYDDEFEHMRKGILGLDESLPADYDWGRLTELSVELQRLRLPMRNAQFGYPVSEQRMSEILDGKIEPVTFDFDRAAG
jgi:hypothetical protein